MTGPARWLSRYRYRRDENRAPGGNPVDPGWPPLMDTHGRLLADSRWRVLTESGWLLA